MDIATETGFQHKTRFSNILIFQGIKKNNRPSNRLFVYSKDSAKKSWIFTKLFANTLQVDLFSCYYFFIRRNLIGLKIGRNPEFIISELVVGSGEQDMHCLVVFICWEIVGWNSGYFILLFLDKSTKQTGCWIGTWKGKQSLGTKRQDTKRHSGLNIIVFL